MLRLRVTPATGEPFEHRLGEAGGEGGDGHAVSVTVGRGRDTDLELSDRFLSRRHARVYRDPEARGERWWIEDLGSQNGTYVNDARIAGPTELRALADEAAERRRMAEELAHGIEEDLVRFTGGAVFHDDRTLVLARRLGIWL